MKAIVERSGLGSLARYAHQVVDKVLIYAFIERFYPDTNTFHLPFGEMSITPDDVRHILDLPVDGEAMTGDSPGSKNLSKQGAYKLLEETLGLKEADVENELDSNRSLKLDWIRERFKGSNEDDDDDTTKHKARAYLLYVIGCVMCPDKSGNMVRVYHLQILRDLDNLRSVCWGNGVLAHLFRELGRASRCGTKSFTGCLTLLQVWIYEHFPKLGRHGYQYGYREPMPRLRKYMSTALERGQEKALVAIREHIDDLKASEVTWDPYKGQRDHYPLQDSAYFQGLFRCFELEQAYCPDRVLRQFGRAQTIPSPACAITIEKTKSTTTSFKPKYQQSLCGWHKRTWRNHLLNPDQRSTPVRDAWECAGDYMAWYSKVSHLRVQNPAARVSVVSQAPAEIPMSTIKRHLLTLSNYILSCGCPVDGLTPTQKKRTLHMVDNALALHDVPEYEVDAVGESQEEDEHGDEKLKEQPIKGGSEVKKRRRKQNPK